MFHQWADQYDQWDNTLYTPVDEDDVGGSNIFNVENHVFNITKIKQDRTSKTRAVSELSKSSNKSDFYGGTSIINTGRLKPIIKPFNSKWNYIQHIIIILISYLMIWSWKCVNMSTIKNKIKTYGNQ